MSAVAARPRRWRPRWLTTRMLAVGSAFTVAIFAFALAVAALNAPPATATSKASSPTTVASPAAPAVVATPRGESDD